MKKSLIFSLLFLIGCKNIIPSDIQPKKVPFNDVSHYSQLKGNLSPLDTIEITDKDFQYCHDTTDCMAVSGDCGWFDGINKHQQEKAKVGLARRYAVIDCEHTESFVDYELSCLNHVCDVKMIGDKSQSKDM